MKVVTLLSTLELTNKGKYELTPLFNLPYFDYQSEFHYDVAALGKYYKVRSEALQKLAKKFVVGTGQYPNVVVAEFNEHSNLVLKKIHAITVGKEPIMSSAAHYIVTVKSTSFPSPNAVRKEIEAIEGAAGLFPLVAITYAAVGQKRTAANVAIALTEPVARKLADILATNGSLVEVLDQETNKVVYSPASKVLGEKKPAVAAAAKEGKTVIEPDYFYVPPVLRDISAVVNAMINSPVYVTTSIIVSGPSGWGKTAFCKPLANALGLKVSYHDMSKILETEEAFGTREIRKGDTEFLFNEFVRDIEAGGHVIVLDEINRTYPGALNAILPLLDWRGTTTIHGRVIKVGPRTVIVATRNVGSAYTGTQSMDGALTSRFSFGAVVDSIPANEEVTMLVKKTGVSKADAALIVKVANAVREQRELGVNVSPRNTEDIARMVVAGIHVRAAYQFNVLLKEEDTDVRVQLENIFNRHCTIEYGPAMEQSRLPSIF